MIFALLSGIAVLAILIAAGAVYQAIGQARDRRNIPPPGALIDVGGRRLHAHCGEGPSPAVVLEAGIGASSVSWALVRRQLSGNTRVCSYDRAGLGWSDSARDARSFTNILDDLRALTRHITPGTPFVLVGHSFGGMLALEYACRHREDLAALVLVDPLTAAEWHPLTEANRKTLARGVRLSRRGVWLARLGVVRFALAMLTTGSRRVPKIFSRVSSGNGAPLTERIVGEMRKLPPEVWPMIQAHWCQPKSFEALADYLEALPANAAAVSPAGCDLGGLPLIVITAPDSPAIRRVEHAKIAQRSQRGRLILAEQSGHWIQLDRPDLVVWAIREVTEEAQRTGRAE